MLDRWHPDGSWEPREPSGFGRLAAPMTAAAVCRADQKDLRQLERILEETPDEVTPGQDPRC
jgi:hypothetical protein